MEFRSLRLSFRYGINAEDKHNLTPFSGTPGTNRDLFFLSCRLLPLESPGMPTPQRQSNIGAAVKALWTSPLLWAQSNGSRDECQRRHGTHQALHLCVYGC